MDQPRISLAEAKARGYASDTLAWLEWAEAVVKEAAALVQEIGQAFDGVPRPRITRSVARGRDDEWTLSEARERELNALDPERTWQEVTDEDVRHSQEYFSFSDAEGWRFYLPAFMCQYLREFPGPGYPAVERACVTREHMDLLNHAQLTCVERFLELSNRMPP